MKGGRGGLAVTLIAVTIWAVAAGCSSPAASAPGAPTLNVVTGFYPLAQAVTQIGQSKVDVVDVVPGGADPFSYRLTSAQAAQVFDAGLVVDVNTQVQPSFTAAARRARRVLTLDQVPGLTGTFVWLDPDEMQRAVTAVAQAMENANPGAAAVYRQGAEDFNDQVASTGVDYQSTLSACPRTAIFTADGAFEPMANLYGLRDTVLGTAASPTAPQTSGFVGQVQTAGVTTVFAEPWVADGLVEAVAEKAGVKVRELDTLAGPPSGGWPAHAATYIDLMESDLGTLSAALGCPNIESDS